MVKSETMNRVKRSKIKGPTGDLMLPSEPALSVLVGLLFAHTIQNLDDLVSDATLALCLLFKVLQYLVARDGKPSTAGGILGHVKHDAFL